MQEMCSRHEILLILLGDQCHASSRSSCWVCVWRGGEQAAIFGSHFYHLQRSWGKVMFLHVSVILFTGRWYPSIHCRWYPSMPCSRYPGGWYPSMPWRSLGPHPGGKLRGLAWGVSRPTPGGGGSWGVWPGGLQAHTQGGLQAHTWGGLQSHTQGVS